MIKRFFSLILAALMTLPVFPAMADEIRYQFDENQPGGTIDLAAWRSSFRGMNQMDMTALRPRAKRIIDGMEYGTDAVAAANYAGTGVTITKQAVSGSLVQEGSYSLKAVIDGTNNRSFGRSLSTNLTPYQSITLWTRSSATASAIQFYLSDGTNSSYWDLTTDASANTWKQHTITLTSPNSNSGSPANRSSITSYGYRLLDNGVTYYFDTIKAIVGMSITVQGTDLGSYYRHVYLAGQPLAVNAQSAPTLTAPVSNPRIDILTIDSAGALAWTAGTENSSPVAPWTSVPSNKMPIAEVYLKTTMTKVVDYEDKDANASDGYILRDVRPWMVLPSAPRKGADVASASSMTLGNDGTMFDITGTTTITSITAKPAGTCVNLQFDGALTVTDGSNLKLNGNFVSAAESTLTLCSDGTAWYEVARQPTASAFIRLSDAPSSYSGQANRVVRVNAGATALEFRDDFNTSTGHDHDGTDSKKVLVANIDVGSITNGYALIRSGSGIIGTAPSGIQIFTSSGTFVAPTGVSNVYLTMIGGGGGGAGSQSGGSSAGGGGAAGAYKINHRFAVTAGNSYTVTVGAGGTGGTVGNNGATGGTTSFDSVSVPGGQGGQGANGGTGAGTGFDASASISTGSTSGGGQTFKGGNGAARNAAPNEGGGAGGSPFGAGGTGGTSGSAGQSAAANTGAGGGGAAGGGSASGGNGAAGFVAVMW